VSGVGFVHGEGPRGKLTAEYRAWANMLRRCDNTKVASFKYYGARGIRVCERWRGSYPAFLEDMGRKPSAAHSLDRIDSDCDYGPDNCRWATRSEQSRNRRIVKRFEFAGEKLPLIEIAQRTGIKLSTLWQRLNSGWPQEKAFSTPLGGRRQ
jgi:hypothetical protein